MAHQGTVERASDISDDQLRWIVEIELATKEMKTFWQQSESITKRYRDTRKFPAPGGSRSGRKFNLFWSNVNVLKPALFKDKGKPRVSRRHNQHDPVGRAASQILERSLTYLVDDYPFEEELEAAVLDRLLVGIGNVKIEYQPITEISILIDSDGKEFESEELVSEAAICRYIHWRDFMWAPGRRWKELRWISFREFMTRDELIERFGKEKGKAVSLEIGPKEVEGPDKHGNAEKFLKQAVVFEIWDRTSRQVWFFSPGAPEILDKTPPPVKFQDFFPCPEPLRATITNDRFMPIPDIHMYIDQLDELNKLTNRIHSLQRAIKAKGIYPGELKETISKIFNETGDDIVAVQDFAAIGDKGGRIGDIVQFLPIEAFVNALMTLYDARDRVIQDIFQISGISDILRGATDPNETLGAQKIKSQFASDRLDSSRRTISKYERSIMRMKAEVIAEVFEPETIRLISGWDDLRANFLTETGQPVPQTSGAVALPPQLQAQQQNLGIGSNSSPDAAQTLGGLSPGQDSDALFNAAIDLIRIDTLRDFKIKVETSNTLAVEQERDRQERLDFLDKAAAILEQVISMVSQAPKMTPLALHLLTFAIRSFPAARDLEEIFEETARNVMKILESGGSLGPEPEPDPRIVTAEIRAELQKAELQVKVEQGKVDDALEAQKIASDREAKLAAIAIQGAGAETQAEAARQRAITDAETSLAKIITATRQSAQGNA